MQFVGLVINRHVLLSFIPPESVSYITRFQWGEAQEACNNVYTIYNEGKSETENYIFHQRYEYENHLKKWY